MSETPDTEADPRVKIADALEYLRREAARFNLVAVVKGIDRVLEVLRADVTRLPSSGPLQ